MYFFSCPFRSRSFSFALARRLVLSVVITFQFLLPAVANNAPATEARVKAAFLLNFPKYVEWPASSFAETNSPFVIAIFGEEEIATEFQKMIQGKTVNGRPLELRRLLSEEECDGRFHILFIAAKRKEVSSVIQKLRGSPVLTVGESPDFVDKGGIINLIRRDVNVRMVVNLTASREAQLKISAKLLNLADDVKGGRSR